MDSFDKHTRKAFTESSQVPEGFGWEDMEAGINQKISEKKRDRKYPVWFWFVPFTFLGLVAFLIVFERVGTANGESFILKGESASYLDMEQVAKVESNELLDESPSVLSNERLDASSIETSNKETATIKTKSNRVALRKNDFDQKLIKDDQQNAAILGLNEQKPNIDNRIIDFVDGAVPSADNKHEVSDLIQKHVATEANSNLDGTIPDDGLVAINDTENYYDYSVLPTVRLFPIIFLGNEQKLSLQGIALRQHIVSDKQLSPKSDLYVLTSFNAGLWSWNNRSNISDFNIADYENTLETYGASVRMGYKVNNWIFETGLMAQVHSSYFEHVFDRKHTILADSTPIYNALTMETSYEAGGTKKVTEKVKIGHFNQYGQIDIPLIVGYKISSKRWGLYAKTGVQVSVLSWEKGRSISEVGELDELETRTEFRKTRGFTYLAEGGLSYELNSKWSVQSGISYAQSISSWMVTETNLRRPLRLNLQIGLIMNLR